MRLEHGRVAGERIGDLANARLGTARTTRSASATGASASAVARDAGEVRVAEVARVAAGLGDRAGLLGVAAGERDLVAALGEERRERRAPRAAADDDDPQRRHERRTKSMIDGHAREPEALAQPVLDPVAVVAGHEAGVVDEDAGSAAGASRPASRRGG